MWIADKIYYQDSSGYTRAYQGSELVWERVYNEAIRLTAKQANSTVGLVAKATGQTLQYSTNGSTWVNMTTATTITLVNSGDSVYIRGTLSSNNTNSNYTQFTMGGNLKVSGNINYLWNYQNISASLKEYCGNRLFYVCTALTDASNMELPSITLVSNCYRSMFNGCTNLTKAPQLPATTLADSCYRFMFQNCTSLTTAPELPAKTLYTESYRQMFNNCSNLNYIKCFATNISATACTTNWVNGVAASGTFVKAFNMTGWTVDSVNGIPIGWTVKEEDVAGVKFTAKQANSTVGLRNKSAYYTLQYTTDGTNWNTMTTATTITLANSGNSVCVRGILSQNQSSTQTIFSMTGNIKVSGNINYIWNYQNPTAVLKQYCGAGLFDNCTALTDASGLQLPSTKLAANCYRLMFFACTNLTKAPTILPATTLADSCYYGMFEGCTSLTTTPEIYATTLSEKCCQEMFMRCSSLVKGPTILPATTPRLPTDCYYAMFEGCTSLTTAPELPATQIGFRSYRYMFNGCTSLNYIKCLITSAGSYATEYWVRGVAANGTFIKNASMNDWTTGESGIPSGWTIQNA